MNGADTAWIIVATALVLFMTLPGLALFYGGLVRARNILGTLTQCYGIACLMSILWAGCRLFNCIRAKRQPILGRVGQGLSHRC